MGVVLMNQNETLDATALTRIVASWLLYYPDEQLMERLDSINALVPTLPSSMSEPLVRFLTHFDSEELRAIQEHYVAMFDMKRKVCPYLTYWTAGDTRNRGVAILKFKQAYLEAGFDLGQKEMPDHLSVVLEFSALGDRLTGDALLAEHAGPIHLLRDALAKLESPYQHVVDAVIATLPELTSEVEERMAHIAAFGPPTEVVGLEPFAISSPVGGRR